MRKSRFSEEQIIRILGRIEAAIRLSTTLSFGAKGWARDQSQARVPRVYQARPGRSKKEEEKGRTSESQAAADTHAGERTMVDGLHDRCTGGWSSIEDAQYRRRRNARMPGNRGRYFDFRPEGSSCTRRCRPDLGLPKRIVVDNGPEFTSKALDQWAYRNGVELVFIRPGRPIENCLVESFNGRFRDECLNLHWFTNLEDARQIIEEWRHDYNHFRPHSSLGGKTPSEFAEQSGLRPTPSTSVLIAPRSGHSEDLPTC